ncbi:DUF4212 domain-containing protein [Piscibacillus halophilus]|uniref:Putative solute:sodium symporter small subunit n=1 Tax=Piscibacillus halophilus TaxID=571933 RepID=A0A1H9JUQ5_9BACI|nr:DUF4212 domain-containing protein [Piscibacillus halophilus]SEQ90532.1 putative solute:sodium symporter small subunit [Piscibacillus halophilus]
MEEKKTLDERQKWYWRKNIRFILGLLVVWAVVAYGGAILFAEPLSNIQFFGVSFSFWIAQQGSILVFFILILTYAIRMDRLDKEYAQLLKEDKEG